LRKYDRQRLYLSADFQRSPVRSTDAVGC
jgi:hypothetical protein